VVIVKVGGFMTGASAGDVRHMLVGDREQCHGECRDQNEEISRFAHRSLPFLARPIPRFDDYCPQRRVVLPYSQFSLD
jgi:hypothetical protein